METSPFPYHAMGDRGVSVRTCPLCVFSTLDTPPLTRRSLFVLEDHDSSPRDFCSTRSRPARRLGLTLAPLYRLVCFFPKTGGLPPNWTSALHGDRISPLPCASSGEVNGPPDEGVIPPLFPLSGPHPPFPRLLTSFERSEAGLKIQLTPFSLKKLDPRVLRPDRASSLNQTMLFPPPLFGVRVRMFV